MSTRIYKDFRLAPEYGTDLAKINQLVQGFRPLVTERVEELTLAYVAEAVVEYLDDVCAGLHEPTAEQEAAWGCLSWIKEDYEKRAAEVERTKRRDDEIDHTFSLAFLVDEKMGRTLGVCLTEQEELWNLWLAQLGVEEYAYYDGSDEQEEELGYKGWKKRRRAWERAWGDGSLGEKGFIIDLAGPVYRRLPGVVDVAERIARDWPLHRRARRVAYERLMNERMEADSVREGGWGVPGARGYDWSALMASSRRNERYLKTDPEGVALLDRTAADMAWQLVPVASVDVLHSNPVPPRLLLAPPAMPDHEMPGHEEGGWAHEG